MSECMDYPQTLRKFANDYSFKDREEVYTNGSMLVPLFRIEQALDEHFMDIEKVQYKTDTDSAYECGYQQGRADKYQEITSEYMLFTEKQVAEIRADAIDEFTSALHNLIVSCGNYVSTAEIRVLAEQLKEESDETIKPI